MPFSGSSFRCERAAVIKLMRRYRATGSLPPGKLGGHRRPILDAERDWLMGRVAEQSDITVRALADELDGPINGESFRAYVEQILLPTLRTATYSPVRPCTVASPPPPNFAFAEFADIYGLSR